MCWPLWFLLSWAILCWVLEAPQSFAYWSALVATEWGFLFTHQEKIDIFTFLSSFLGPETQRWICAGLPVRCHHQSHLNFLSGDRFRYLMPTWGADRSRCSTFKVVLSLLFLFSCQVKKRNWCLFSEPPFSPCKVLIINVQNFKNLFFYSSNLHLLTVYYIQSTVLRIHEDSIWVQRDKQRTERVQVLAEILDLGLLWCHQHVVTLNKSFPLRNSVSSSVKGVGAGWSPRPRSCVFRWV